MSLTAASPRDSALPPLPLEGDKRSFQSDLRKREAEFHALQQHNFDLRIKIHHLERKLLNQVEPRRASATPPPDDFYDFNDVEETEPQAKADAHFDDDNPVVKALRRELANVRADNESLVEKNHQLADALDDLREKNVADAEEAHAKSNSQHKEMQILVNQVEDLQSENFKLTIEVAQAREGLDATRREMETERQEIVRMEQRENAAKVCAEGLNMQFKATVTALEEQKEVAEEATKKMAAKTIELAGTQKELRRAREFAEEARLQNEEAAGALQAMQNEIGELKVERDVAQEGLKAEKERGKIWTETEKMLREDDLLLTGDGGALEQLVKVLQGQQKAYDNVSAYQPRWRELVLNDMNECLRALYRSQREVEAKRRHFVEHLCATSTANEPLVATSKPQAAAPVS